MSALLERTGPVACLDRLEDLAAGLVPHSFPSVDDVDSMAGRLRVRVGTHTGADVAGVRSYLGVSAGTVSLRERTVYRLDVTPDDEVAAAADDAAARTEQGVQGVLDVELVDDLARTRAKISEWSPGSRRRMVRAIAELDLSGWHEDGGTLAMVTLTLPGWWEWIAPDGASWKRLVRVLQLRWTRAIGPWRGLWKMEFQRRGAPHQHMLMRVPALVRGVRFEDWLARTWADICFDAMVKRSERAALAYVELGEYDKHVSAGTGVDFSGVKFSDPRRTSIYFLKHSSKTRDSKEYQHIVPALWREGGPGRFWGVWGLDRATAELEVDRQHFVRARRILRHVALASAARADMQRRRGEGESVWTMKRPKRRGGFGSTGGGWVLANDGLGLAWDVGRALALE